MESSRRTALVAGLFFILAFVASVPGPFGLYGGVLHDARYVLGGGSKDTMASLGAFFEVVTAIAVMGTAITLYPVVKRQQGSIALGYVAGRVFEATMIVVGLLSLLAIVTLRQDYAGATGPTADSLLVTSRSLVAVHDWTFLLGPNLALGPNTLMLAYLMYRSRLVPRAIAVLGLVGGPLIFGFAVAVMFGVTEQVSAFGALAALPVFAWEMSLATWLIVKGFRPSAVASLEAPRAVTIDATPSLAAVAN